MSRIGRRIINFVLVLFMFSAIALAIPGCSKIEVITNPNDLPIDYDTSRLIKFQIVMESGDVVEGELYPLEAPITVRNFVTLAESGYYNGMEFNRIISDKLVQCSGSVSSDDAPYHIRGEFSDNGWNNDLEHDRGTISMARKTDEYDSAYGAFFILLEKRFYYDGEYAAFGKITSGIASLQSLSEAEVDGTAPLEPIVIKEIDILGN